ncbi:hypothetical protein BJI69_14205 [Luteibacter rhizovicinus DSM 16549]|uniref:Uncharacterized protein n=1 Tax=Luteibacter rhizovicinus DSM 16549 TaxID=1440763 RepID=A0A1L3EV82_9GAMM|nr:BRCT domain-containing protein [Luteibacter rhizovicinus]APG04930.1 hypothetical protein BJI69_14205 [Luteibacter rhizovicinus DSM 16549]
MFKIDDGAAPNAAMTRSWRMDRSTNELLGICRGILADGEVNRTEAKFLLDWLDRHVEFAQHFPYNVLYPRVAEALADGVLDLDEERDLLEALTATVGGEIAHPNGANSLSTELPYDEPLPTILHSASVFVVTGTFTFGKRAAVCEAIEARHGVVRAAVSGSTDYVIVGEIGSRDWLHSSYGRKIQEAADFRQQGKMISIVPERHWSGSLKPLIVDSPIQY